MCEYSISLGRKIHFSPDDCLLNMTMSVLLVLECGVRGLASGSYQNNLAHFMTNKQKWARNKLHTPAHFPPPHHLFSGGFNVVVHTHLVQEGGLEALTLLRM